MTAQRDALVRLQVLLDQSYAQSGRHLRAIHTPQARLSADEVVAAYQGMKVAVVATVSSDGRPYTAPVDTFLHGGHVYFGTDPHAVRARHLDQNPAVSVTYADGEAVVITVHGEAVAADLHGADASFAARTRAHYGQGWDEWEPAPRVWWINPRRMFAADMSVHTASATPVTPES